MVCGSVLHMSADAFNSNPALDRPLRAFSTTHWSLVLLAGKQQSGQSSAALEKLCRAYWPPLYSFIRRRGYAEHDAQDLTQEFFARFLKRNDFENVDPVKGRFRTYLLAALENFLSNQWDRSQAIKRGGGCAFLSLDEINAEQWHSFEPRDDLSPDKVFDAHWAASVLNHALTRLRSDMAEEGKGELFDTLKPFLTSEPGEGEYAAAGQRLQRPAATVAVWVHRLRQRYREFVRMEVAQTLANPLDLDLEMRHLLEALS